MQFDVDRLAQVMNLAEKMGLVTEDSAGTSSDWHPGMFVLLAGIVAYDIDGDAVSRTCGLTTLDALLAVARAHGFGSSDALRTLLARDDYNERAVTLAREAMQRVTSEELSSALRRGGFVLE